MYVCMYVFRIPKSRIPDSRSKNFQDYYSGICIPFQRGDISFANVTRALMCIYNFLAKNCWSFSWLSSRSGFHSKTTSMLKLMFIFIKKMCNHATNMTRDHHSVSVSKSHWFSSNSWQHLETKSTTCFRYLNVVMRRGNPVQGYWTY